jgi:hypothetical protein
VATALVTGAYRAAQEIAAVVPSEVAPADSVDRTHVPAVVEDLPAWEAVEVEEAVEDSAVVAVVAAVAVAVVVAAEVAEGGNKS